MIRLLSGDCRDVLPTLPAESVQCCITSPPYYALRSYLDASHPDKHREIGSESTPDEYLATMVGVFREVRRVLRPDGTCWVNMGDSYSAVGRDDAARRKDTPGVARPSEDKRCERCGEPFRGGVARRFCSSFCGGIDNSKRAERPGGIKPKDLLLMPARLALALQADGWWVRSDIIWHKPNPMPESVTDRCTSAHEYVFMLTKAPRYYFDNEAIREDWAAEPRARGQRAPGDARRNPAERTDWPAGVVEDREGRGGRSCRNVWTIATHSFAAAHFATYPPELAERCIKAGTSERGCCAACGKPWVRVTDVSYVPTDTGGGSSGVDRGRYDGAGVGYRPGNIVSKRSTTTGWSPGCQCGAATVPCTVLDPFAGAGTTLLVADRLQRDAIGVELNTAYTEMAMERCRQDAPLFTSFPPAEPPEDERMADLFTDMAAD